MKFRRPSNLDGRPVFYGRPSLAAAVLALGIAAVYAGSFAGVLVLDDPGAIAANPTIRHLATALNPPSGGLPVSGRPIANLSFALNFAMGGTDLWGYHATNLLIHVLATLALWGILRRSLPRFGFEGEGAFAAFAVALIWGIHPLQTQSVTYLSQRVESLMGLFYLGTLYCFIRSVQVGSPRDGQAVGKPPNAPGARVGRLGLWGLLSVACCFLGMATKEVMVTAPVVVFLYDRTCVAGSAAEAWRARRGFYAALASSWIVLAILVFGSGGRGGTAGFQAGFAWWEYAITQVGAVAHYLRLSIWPDPLVADYGRRFGGSARELAGDLLVEGVLAAGSVAALMRPPAGRGAAWRGFGFAGVCFFLILAPSSSVVPVTTELIAEHRMYLPLACVAAAVVCAAAAAGGDLAKRLGWRRGLRVALAAALLLAAAAALGTMTVRRNRTYRSLHAFWSDVAEKVPGNAGAHNNLGNVLAGSGDLAGASAQFREALQWVPGYADAHFNLGGVLVREGRLAEAADHFRAAVEGRPDFAEAHVEYGNALAQLDRAADAMREYSAALALEPDLAEVHNNLGGLLAQSGRLAEARAHFEAALRLRPGYGEARNNLQKVLRMERDGPGR